MMLVTWVMELYLNQLGELRDSTRMSGYEGMQDEFRKFLNQSKVKVCHIFLCHKFDFVPSFKFYLP